MTPVLLGCIVGLVVTVFRRAFWKDTLRTTSERLREEKP